MPLLSMREVRERQAEAMRVAFAVGVAVGLVVGVTGCAVLAIVGWLAR